MISGFAVIRAIPTELHLPSRMLLPSVAKSLSNSLVLTAGLAPVLALLSGQVLLLQPLSLMTVGNFILLQIALLLSTTLVLELVRCYKYRTPQSRVYGFDDIMTLRKMYCLSFIGSCFNHICTLGFALGSKNASETSTLADDIAKVAHGSLLRTKIPFLTLGFLMGCITLATACASCVRYLHPTNRCISCFVKRSPSVLVASISLGPGSIVPLLWLWREGRLRYEVISKLE